jgi:hypothetical protein
MVPANQLQSTNNENLVIVILYSSCHWLRNDAWFNVTGQKFVMCNFLGIYCIFYQNSAFSPNVEMPLVPGFAGVRQMSCSEY